MIFFAIFFTSCRGEIHKGEFETWKPLYKLVDNLQLNERSQFSNRFLLLTLLFHRETLYLVDRILVFVEALLTITVFQVVPDYRKL